MKIGRIIKKFKSKKGNDVVFRYPNREDLNDMLTFANNLIREDTFVELSGKELTRGEEKKVLHKILEDMEKNRKRHIVVFVNGMFAGNGEIRVGSRRKSHTGELGIALASQFRGEGIGSELINTLIDEGRSLLLRLLTINCFENNIGACHLYEKLGFTKAGIIPNAIKWKENYVGEIKFYLPLV